MAWDAVVLSGGTSRRMGGGDKTAELLGGRTLLDGVLEASAGAARTVVVGAQRATARAVTWTREDPPGGGPLAGVAAGVLLVTAPVVVLLAADLLALDAAAVAALVEHAPAHAVDDDGRPQWLCSAWPTAALRAATGETDPHGGRLGAVLSRLGGAGLDLGPAGWLDCDTPEDLARAREAR